MPIVKAKPTSPGRRFVIKVVHPDLHKGEPHKALLEEKSKKGGRNNNGRITTRHIGGGRKQHYRVLDFKRTMGEIDAYEFKPEVQRKLLRDNVIQIYGLDESIGE